MEWKENPHLKNQSLFMGRVYNEDIFPCLNFPNKKVIYILILFTFIINNMSLYIYKCFFLKKMSEDLLSAIELNLVCIEDLNIAQTKQSDDENFAQ